MGDPQPAPRHDGGQVKIVTTAEGRRVVLSGEIDMLCREALDSALLRATEGTPVAVIELAGVTFLSSDGLAFLAQLHRRADALGQSVTLLDPPRVAQRALALSGLLSLFTVATSRAS